MVSVKTIGQHILLPFHVIVNEHRWKCLLAIHRYGIFVDNVLINLNTRLRIQIDPVYPSITFGTNRCSLISRISTKQINTSLRKSRYANGINQRVSDQRSHYTTNAVSIIQRSAPQTSRGVIAHRLEFVNTEVSPH